MTRSQTLSVSGTLGFFLVVLATLPSCAAAIPEGGATNESGSSARSATSRSAPAYRSVLIRDLPHVRQKPDFCGEACVEMMLRKERRGVDQSDVFNLARVDPALGRGCHAPELDRVIRKIGIDTGTVWSYVSVKSLAKDMEARWKVLHEDLLRGVPSIICTRYDARPNTTEHFRLILGYDAKTDEVIYHEPAVDEGAYRRMKRALVLELWPLKYDRDRWTTIRMRLDTKRLLPKDQLARMARVGGASDASKTKRFSKADFAQHILELKKRLPEPGFTVLVEEPFVVVGDESPDVVRRRSKDTIRWAVDRLKRQYFEKDPNEIIDIWLFRSKASYQRNVRKLWNDEPSTPFGYYSSKHRALVMNIATGGGTLVHEIVHPFIESNFPECPSWFNEGLASLYEQCADRRGRIVGLTNWRLAGLQAAIRASEVPSFRTLTSTTTHEFYREDPGTNYSQARYLCYYLQERGLLGDFYRKFHKARKKDPSGYGTLRTVLEEEDMKSFQKRWQRWVLGLRFR